MNDRPALTVVYNDDKVWLDSLNVDTNGEVMETSFESATPKIAKKKKKIVLRGIEQELLNADDEEPPRSTLVAADAARSQLMLATDIARSRLMESADTACSQLMVATDVARTQSTVATDTAHSQSTVATVETSLITEPLRLWSQSNDVSDQDGPSREDDVMPRKSVGTKGKKKTPVIDSANSRRSKSPSESSRRRKKKRTNSDGAPSREDDAMPRKSVGTKGKKTMVIDSSTSTRSNSPSESPRPRKKKRTNSPVSLEKLSEMLYELKNSLSDASLSRNRASKSCDRPNTRTSDSGDVEVEIQPGSGVFVDEIELKMNILRMKKSPKEMVRRLLVYLVGVEKLKMMTGRGRVTKPGKKTRQDAKLTAVPEKILQAIKYYVDRKSTLTLDWPSFIRIVNLKCYNLRHPKNKDKTVEEPVGDEDD